MKNEKENAIKLVIDARSTCNEFNEYLRTQGLLSNYPESYAKDGHYEGHGFGFIETEEDIDDFLNQLDDAPTWHNMGNGECKKACRFRSALKRLDSFNWGKVRRFKIYASSARRIHCGCHETGSFHPNKKS